MEGICDAGLDVPDIYPGRNPFNATFELTIRCNLHCKMCLFRHDDSENPCLREKELTAQQWIDIGRQAADAGTMTILFTGGEPLLRPDFSEIYEEIYKLGFMITVYTNATLVNDKVMELFHKYPPHAIGVTIYGASPETYQKVTGDSTAFEKFIRGFRMLQELPSNLSVRTTLIHDNIADLEAMEELLKNLHYTGELTHSHYVVNGVRGACAKNSEIRLTPEENTELVLKRHYRNIKRSMEEAGFNTDYLQVAYEDTDKKCASEDSGRHGLIGCDAGYTSYTISYDGRLLGCQLLDVFSTDAGEYGIKKAWEAFPEAVHLPGETACDNCEFSNGCSACPAFRYAETNSFYTCAEYFRECSIAKQFLKEGACYYENEKLHKA